MQKGNRFHEQLAQQIFLKDAKKQKQKVLLSDVVKWSQITITYKSSKGYVNIRNSLLRHAQQYQETLPPFHLKESNLQLKLAPRAWTHFNF